MDRDKLRPDLTPYVRWNNHDLVRRRVDALDNSDIALVVAVELEIAFDDICSHQFAATPNLLP